MNAQSIIDQIKRGGVLTMRELELYLRTLEIDAFSRGGEGTKRFLLARLKKGSENKANRLEKEFQEIMADVSDFCYNMRRLRNGQDITASAADRTRKVLEEQARDSDQGKEDRRFRGEEKISV